MHNLVREVSIIAIYYFQKAAASTYCIYHDQIWHSDSTVIFNPVFAIAV